ncbi:hypothetical protein TTHERM_000697299 (macronuclear) [Tetrahymena thermophila SB210]|uniref:Uncharacterized protein n=1 Tax=Tetrahymena thermophila (strain SB210) TaxID=312017 RepID=W7X5A1_TETTS|nr:hypothetical protein TTHERM_000697299 [Tetrahymena thermophila SB210]EWS71538.1 hypothetical protein TTHERM_000697299 [Tetrahymena thermophila SB210]|eukprot:XP_012655921.1 hypothetical protein TTHERM_000697299 [Tetrahymena thermophila SB210]
MVKIIIYDKNDKKFVSCRIRTCAGKPNGFQVHLLNHSDKLTQLIEIKTLQLKNSSAAGFEPARVNPMDFKSTSLTTRTN